MCSFCIRVFEWSINRSSAQMEVAIIAEICIKWTQLQLHLLLLLQFNRILLIGQKSYSMPTTSVGSVHQSLVFWINHAFHGLSSPMRSAQWHFTFIQLGFYACSTDCVRVITIWFVWAQDIIGRCRSRASIEIALFANGFTFCGNEIACSQMHLLIVWNIVKCEQCWWWWHL